jgi:hypothetical protein
MPSSWSLSWFWSRFHALSEAARGAAADLVQPRLDQSDLTIVIQIELERGQGQRHDRREQQHGGQQPGHDAAARPVEDPRQERREHRRRERGADAGQILLRSRRRNGAATLGLIVTCVAHAPCPREWRHLLSLPIAAASKVNG